MLYFGAIFRLLIYTGSCRTVFQFSVAWFLYYTFLHYLFVDIQSSAFNSINSVKLSGIGHWISLSQLN